MPWIEGFDSLRRPLSAQKLIARELMRVGGKQRRIEIGQNQATKNITSDAMNNIIP